MLRKFLSIAGTTFAETIRQPIYFVLLWAAVGLLLLNPGLAAYSLKAGQDNAVMQDVAVATMMLYGLLASVFSATGVITREIESFTVLTVISKPVSRPLFLVGKFAGVAAAIAVAYYFLAIVFLMTVRHGVMETNADKFDLPVIVFGLTALAISLAVATFGNYVYGWNFLTTFTGWIVPAATLALAAALFFSREWAPQSPLFDFTDEEKGAFYNLRVIYAILMSFMAVLVLAAFAVALSTRFSEAVTLTLCVAIYLLGLFSDYAFGSADSAALAKLLYYVVPNFQFFWVGDALTQKIDIPLAQVGRVVGYGALYTLAVLSLGVAMFQTREVG